MKIEPRKIIVFDLYDTILKDLSFDFQAGLEYLYSTHFSEECGLEDFLTFSLSFLPMLQERDITNNEVSFLADEYAVYCQQLEVEPLATDQELLELDYQVMCHSQKEQLLPQVKECLEQLTARGYSLYILTNSIFHSQCHKRLLEEFGIGDHFRDLYCSCDIGKRKPGPEAFEYAFGQIQAANPGLTKDQLVFIGNDYDADIKGAISAGIPAIWYNPEGQPDYDSLNFTQFRSFADLPDLLESE